MPFSPFGASGVLKASVSAFFGYLGFDEVRLFYLNLCVLPILIFFYFSSFIGHFFILHFCHFSLFILHLKKFQHFHSVMFRYHFSRYFCHFLLYFSSF